MAHQSRTEGAAGDSAEPSFKGENVYPNRRGNFQQKSRLNKLQRLQHACGLIAKGKQKNN